MENDLFLKISSSEYISYSKDSEASEAGNIKSLITVTNRVCGGERLERVLTEF